MNNNKKARIINKPIKMKIEELINVSNVATFIMHDDMTKKSFIEDVETYTEFKNRMFMLDGNIKCENLREILKCQKVLIYTLPSPIKMGNESTLQYLSNKTIPKSLIYMAYDVRCIELVNGEYIVKILKSIEVENNQHTDYPQDIIKKNSLYSKLGVMGDNNENER